VNQRSLGADKEINGLVKIAERLRNSTSGFKTKGSESSGKIYKEMNNLLDSMGTLRDSVRQECGERL